MPANGEYYEHKQIKGERYRVRALDTTESKVYLVNTNGQEKGFWVKFDNLAKSYRKV